MTDIPPITPLEQPERRQSERRADWHTPETCFKLLDVQTTMDSIFTHLAEGKARMDCIEGKLDANNKATDELLEIIQMGKGFFRAVGWIGKWIRRVIMWVVPPIVAIIGLWQALTSKHP
jgi:hypothetical protein